MIREVHINPSITPRDSDSLVAYFNDISSSTPLSPDEEVELAERIRQGDMHARNQLVCANLKFVVSVAKLYQSCGVALSDLVNEGNIGLIRAAERYDPTRGFKFSTCAVWWIRQAILSAIAQTGRHIRLPLNVSSWLSRVKKVQQQFEQENYRMPTAEELSELMNIPLERMEELIQPQTVSSLDAPLTDESESTMADVLTNMSQPTDAKLTQESMCHDIEVAVNSLNEKEQQVIRLCFGLGGEVQSLDTIAEEMNLSRERVRQLCVTALQHLRRKSLDLKQYVS